MAVQERSTHAWICNEHLFRSPTGARWIVEHEGSTTITCAYTRTSTGSPQRPLSRRKQRPTEIRLRLRTKHIGRGVNPLMGPNNLAEDAQ